MVSIQTDQTAEQHIDEVDAFWGARFRREYMARLALLSRCPLAGHPYSHPVYQGIHRILLRGCQHYVYYRYERNKQLLTILAVWSNSRKKGPFDR